MKRLVLPLSGLLLGACAQLPHNVVTNSGTSIATNASFDGNGYPVEVCSANYVGTVASCTIRGTGQAQRIKANIISGGKIYVGGEMRVEPDGKISAAACQVPSADAITLDCPGALVSAGFMNLHEHIDYSYQQPPQPPKLKWVHRNEWRKLLPAERGFEGDAPKDETVRTEVSERAMLRHMLNGSTAISGAKDYRAFLRNLKLADGLLATPVGLPVLDNTFPLNDARSMQWPTAPCTAEQIASIKVNAANPFIPHVGEGTNDGARMEVDCVLDAVKAKTTPNAFIHGVAISDAQVARMKAQDVAVVLSPRSNFQLYGSTAPIKALKKAGVTLAIGTDWSPSGSLTVLDEARCLARYNHDSLGDLLSWADIHQMMTSGGAKAVGLQEKLGSLSPGQLADFVVIDTNGARSLADVLTSTGQQATLAVFVAGRAASLPTSWAGKLPQLDHCASDPRDLCGQQRTICGVNAARPLAKLLEQATYHIDDAKLCRPLPTDDCVVR